MEIKKCPLVDTFLFMSYVKIYCWGLVELGEEGCHFGSDLGVGWVADAAEMGVVNFTSRFIGAVLY